MIRRLNIRDIDISRAKKYSDISTIVENAITTALIKDNIPEDSIINIIERNWNDDWYEITIYYKGEQE